MEVITLTPIDDKPHLTTIDEIAHAEDEIYTEISAKFMAVVADQIADLSDGLVDASNVSTWLQIYSLASFYGFNSTFNGFWGVAEAANLSDPDISLVMVLHERYMDEWKIKSNDIQFNKSPELYNRYLMSL
jgi:hypothetical protein